MSRKVPKLFVSYSWTDQQHMDWVLQLATDLRAQGVDAILDKWHLREGQDAYAFMEQMVTNSEVEKVILVCDRKYVERADQRLGGVGAESQIMSAELYGKVDQTKFVAICCENDERGRALLPAFMRSRIFVDFTSSELYDERLEQIIRWCFDKPLFVQPELGEAPAFLDENIAPIVRRQAQFDRASRYSADGLSDPTAIIDFFRSISSLEALPKIQEFVEEEKDEQVYKSIIGLAPLISKVLSTFEKAVRRKESAVVAGEEFHRYLEFIVSHYDAGRTSWSDDVLKFYGQFMLVAAVAVLVDNGKSKIADELLNTPFVLDEYGGMTAKGVSFTRVGAYLKSLQYRNDRLELRRLSLHADLIKAVCEIANFSFRSFIQADLALFLRAIIISDRWWPNSALYVNDAHGALPWYVRATSSKHREQITSLLKIESKARLDQLILAFKSGSEKNPQWSGGWSSLNTLELTNLENISAAWQ